MRSGWMRRAAGFVWLAAWMAVLWGVAAPWRHLGGIESERLRWLEAVVLLGGLILGATLGRFGRDAVLRGGGRTHAGLLRFVLYPPAALAAAGLIVLTALGQRGAAGVLVSALLAYWAGLDIAFGALPLMEGRSYRFDAPLDPEGEHRGRRSHASLPWDAF
jgi:hypothetical protein